MLPSRPKKGHAYTRWEKFKALPVATQLLVGAGSLTLLWLVMAMFGGGHGRGGDGTSDSGAGGGAMELGTDLSSIQTQLGNSLKHNRVLQNEVDKLRGQVVSLSTERTQKLNKLGLGLGLFDWESFIMEPNSTDRRFWIKTATNEEGHHFYRRILIMNGWIETADPKAPECVFQFYGRFVPGLTGEFSMFTEGRNLINHIPGEYAVLNKEPFLHYMRNNSQKKGCDYTQMHPESYLIHDPQDCIDLFQIGHGVASSFGPRSRESQTERDNSYWFWKPPFNSFGRGIKISTLSTLREKFGFGKDVLAAPNAQALVEQRCHALAANLTKSKSKLLIQRAVDQPYLIGGSKFDFRAYILIANAKPYAVYHKFGHVRRCLRRFSIHSKVKKAHVCNDYSDELENPDFPLSDHIWDLNKFRAYLVALGYSQEEVDGAFVTNLKRLFLGVFNMFKDELPRKNGYWLMLGIDVAIDKDFGVKVLEINTNPSMHYGTKIWGQEMVTRNWRQMNEVLQLVMDCHNKAPRVPIAQEELVMSTKYGWELLYSEYTYPAFSFSNERCFEQKLQTRHPKGLGRSPPLPVLPEGEANMDNL